MDRLYLEIKAYNAPAKKVWGFASIPVVDRQGEEIKAEAWPAAVAHYLTQGNRKIMLEHGNKQVGEAANLQMDKSGLWIEGNVTDPEAGQMVADGRLNSFSVGFDFANEWTSKEKGIRSFHKLLLNEISLTKTPANQGAYFQGYKMLDQQKVEVNAETGEMVLSNLSHEEMALILRLFGQVVSPESMPGDATAIKSISLKSMDAEVKAISNAPWDGSKSRFSVEELLRAVPEAIARWARAQAKKENRAVIKDDLHLPYKEPNGTINLNGVRNALSRLPQVQGVPSDILAEAKKELEAILARYSSKKTNPSDSDRGDAMNELETLTKRVDEQDKLVKDLKGFVEKGLSELQTGMKQLGDTLGKEKAEKTQPPQADGVLVQGLKTATDQLAEVSKQLKEQGTKSEAQVKALETQGKDIETLKAAFALQGKQFEALQKAIMEYGPESAVKKFAAIVPNGANNGQVQMPKLGVAQ